MIYFDYLQALSAEQGVELRKLEERKLMDVKVKADREEAERLQKAQEEYSGRAIKGATEEAALKLRLVGDVAEADRVEFVETLRQKEVEAAKFGEAELVAQKRRDSLALQNFDAEQKKVRGEAVDKALDDFFAPIEKATEKATEKAKGTEADAPKFGSIATPQTATALSSGSIAGQVRPGGVTPETQIAKATADSAVTLKGMKSTLDNILGALKNQAANLAQWAPIS